MEHGQPVGTGGGKDVYSITFGHTELSQPGAHVKAQGLVVVEADVFVGTELEVGPGFVDLLLLAIDDFLDLLRFLVRADEPPRAHALCVSILGNTDAHELVGGRDVVGGFRDQAIFGERMSSRLCLAFDFGGTGGFDGEGAAHRLLGLQDDVLVLGLLPLVLRHGAVDLLELIQGKGMTDVGE